MMNDIHAEAGHPSDAAGIIDQHWHDDSVMSGYQRRTVALGKDSEGDAIATFVRKAPSTAPRHRQRNAEGWRTPGYWAARLETGFRRRPAPAPPKAILYLHGWNDYFYRQHVSEYWESLGVRFYALDLRRYGRSLRSGEISGYIEDMHEYKAELNALHDLIIQELGDDVNIMLVGHSQGGLIASLWMNEEHPSHITAMALNSPWLELQGNRMLRIISTPVLRGLLLRGGHSALPIPDPGFYQKTILKKLGGQWSYDAYPFTEEQQFIPRAGWLEAIYRAQAEISGGLDIQVPILVSTSDHSMLQLTWDERMRESDTVLDVIAIREAALKLGDLVTIATIHHGIHDLTMSYPKPRRKYFSLVTQWASQNAWHEQFPEQQLAEALDWVSTAERQLFAPVQEHADSVTNDLPQHSATAQQPIQLDGAAHGTEGTL
jgi:alpha-beta hydrolase superfamily lysophospholipase